MSDYVWQGLEDGGHNILECKGCHKPLADVWVTKPAEVSFDYMAQCPFCNDESEITTVKGLVHIGSVEGTRLFSRKLVESDGKSICVIKLTKEAK